LTLSYVKYGQKRHRINFIINTPTPGVDIIPEFPSIGLPFAAAIVMLLIMKKLK